MSDSLTCRPSDVKEHTVVPVTLSKVRKNRHDNQGLRFGKGPPTPSPPESPVVVVPSFRRTGSTEVGRLKYYLPSNRKGRFRYLKLTRKISGVFVYIREFLWETIERVLYFH